MPIINLKSLIGHSMGITPQDGVSVREFIQDVTTPIVLSFEGISLMTWEFMSEAFRDLTQIDVYDSAPNPQYFNKFLSQRYSQTG